MSSTCPSPSIFLFLLLVLCVAKRFSLCTHKEVCIGKEMMPVVLCGNHFSCCRHHSGQIQAIQKAFHSISPVTNFSPSLSHSRAWARARVCVCVYRSVYNICDVVFIHTTISLAFIRNYSERLYISSKYSLHHIYAILYISIPFGLSPLAFVWNPKKLSQIKPKSVVLHTTRVK